MKKILIAAAALLVVCAVGLFFWARSVLTGDAVRTAVASQLSQALGQPVEVGGVSASIYPRVTMTLSQVRIGQPNTVEVGNLDVGTDFGALLSRRIEHASLRVDGAHIQLPLPPITIGGGGSSGPSPASGGAPVEIVSIDEITLSDVEIKSGGRTLRGDIELVPRGTQGFEVRRIALAAADTTVEITGEITTLSPPTGTLAMKAGVLDFDTLMAFLSDFSSGASAAATPPPEQATAAVDPTASLRPASASASSGEAGKRFGRPAGDAASGHRHCDDDRRRPRDVRRSHARQGLGEGAHRARRAPAGSDHVRRLRRAV
jgi:hypothetical protein